MRNSKFSVVSSYATDILVNAQGEIISKQDGGPALYVMRALEECNVKADIISGKKIIVEILLKDSQEFGRVPVLPQKNRVNTNALKPWTIISTVCNEWVLSAPLPDKLMVDLQGFVRDGSNFGKKTLSPEINKFAGEIYCLKGTEEEVACLTKKAIERQKTRMLVITNGPKPVTLYVNNEKSMISVVAVENPKDTIGAGDSFFAYFAAGLHQGLMPSRAVRYANCKTAVFLQKKSVNKI